MVYGTYNYSIHGVYKPSNITGGAPPSSDNLMVDIPKQWNTMILIPIIPIIYHGLWFMVDINSKSPLYTMVNPHF